LTIEVWQFIGVMLSSNLLTVLISKLLEKKRTKAETDGIYIENAVNFDQWKDKQIKDLIARVTALETSLETERKDHNAKMKLMQAEIDSLKTKSRSYEK